MGTIIALMQSTYFIGQIVGCLFLGPIVDNLGRKTGIMIAEPIRCIGGLIAYFSVNWWMLLISRAVIAVGSTICYNAAYVLLLEMMGPKIRGKVGLIFHAFYTTGWLLLTVMAYIFP